MKKGELTGENTREEIPAREFGQRRICLTLFCFSPISSVFVTVLAF